MWNPVWGKELEKIKRRNYRREFRMYFKDGALTGCVLEPVSILQHKAWWSGAFRSLSPTGGNGTQHKLGLRGFSRETSWLYLKCFFLPFIFIFLSFKSDFHCFPAGSAPPWASREHLRKSLTFEFKTSNYLHCGVEVGKSVEDREAALWPHSSTESFAEGKASGGGWLESCFVRQ